MDQLQEDKFVLFRLENLLYTVLQDFVLKFLFPVFVNHIILEIFDLLLYGETGPYTAKLRQKAELFAGVFSNEFSDD